MQAVAGEPALREAHGVLHPHIHFALAALCELLECEDPGNLPPAVLKILPPTPEAILAPLLHAASTTPPRRKKVQGTLTGAVALNLHRRRKLKAFCDDTACPEYQGHTKSDMLHTSLVLLRSQQSRMLQAPLSFPRNRPP